MMRKRRRNKKENERDRGRVIGRRLRGGIGKEEGRGRGRGGGGGGRGRDGGYLVHDGDRRADNGATRRLVGHSTNPIEGHGTSRRKDEQGQPQRQRG